MSLILSIPIKLSVIVVNKTKIRVLIFKRGCKGLGCCIIIMSEELSYELYKWLSTLEVVPPSLRYKSNGNYELDNKTTQGLLNGSLVSRLLEVIAAETGAVINQPLLSSIKHSSTPAARMYNWNILSQSFLKLNIQVPKETQKQITSGNFSSLVRFLLDLHKRFNPKKIEKKQENQAPELNLKKLQVLQTYEQAQNFLELVIMIISTNLNLTPKQAVSTLNEQAKYYAHMVVKGIKNSFSEILDMLETFIKQLPKLMFLCEKSPETNTEFLLDLIKPTLISRDSDVSKKGAQLFRKVLEESLKYNSKNIIYQILTKQNVGFDFLYMAIKRHSDLIHDFTPFVFLMVNHGLSDFFEVHLKRTINNQQEYLKIVLRLVEGLSAMAESKTAIKQSGMLNVWLKDCEASFGNKVSREQGAANEETKLLYLQLLCNLWKDFSNEIDQEEAEQILARGLYQLKKNTRNEIYTIKIPALLRLFDFLHYLADSKSKMAALLYKQLIFLLIENHDQTDIREIILSNFSIMLQQYPTIPVEFLLQPYLKQLQTSQGKSYILNIFDFDFLVELCKHPKMDVSYALSYLQYLTKLYIKSYIYARLTARVIKILTSRFCQEETIIQFLKKTIQSTLNQYGVLTFNKKKSSKEDAIVNKQKQSLSIELIKHFIQLEHQELRAFILNRVTGLYTLWLDTKNHRNKGLKYLIELYGDLEQICLQYKINQNKQSADTPQLQDQSENTYTKPTPKSQAYQQLQYMKRKGIGYKESKKPNKTHVQSRLQLNTLNLKPAPKALEDLEKIRDKLKQGASRKRLQEDNQLRRLKQKNSAASLELMQRNLSLGYAKILPQYQDHIFFEFDSVKQKQLKMSIKFHSLDELEDIDQETAKTILKLHSKDIKSLFLKYALISNSENFRREESASVMSFTSAVKMINEKGIGFINKLVISDLIASINANKRKEKNILFGIEEGDFHEFLLKLTDYLIQIQTSTVQIPFGLRLQRLLQSLFSSQNFYQNRLRVKEDPKIARVKEALNSGQQSEFLVPEGYKKVRETHVELTHQVADADWGVAAKYKIGYEVADWLLNRALGFHIVTPLASISQRFNLIQIPKPVKLTFSKQQTDPNIKYEPETKEQKIDSPDRYSDKNRKVKLPQRRSQSQRIVHKNKTGPGLLSEEDKQKEAKKRQEYSMKLKQNLERLRQEKAQKEEQKRKAQAEQQQKEKKKDQERKKYLEINKQKLKHHKERENEQGRLKQEEEKRKKEKIIQEHKRREKELLERHKENIKKMLQRSTDKKKVLQHSKDKPLRQSQRPKEPVNNEQIEADKARMVAVKTSLDNGALRSIVKEYDKQLNELFQTYWLWEKKRIDLNSLALMMKDFEISPQYLSPKGLADTYKGISKGQPLDFEGFVQFLAKCGYRSKLAKESAKEVDESVLIRLLELLKMKQFNYKEVLKKKKNHI